MSKQSQAAVAVEKPDTPAPVVRRVAQDPIARVESLFAMGPLFRPLGPGDRQRLKTDFTFVKGNDLEVRFVGFEPLDISDQSVLLGILALLGADKITVRPTQSGDAENDEPADPGETVPPLDFECLPALAPEHDSRARSKTLIELLRRQGSACDDPMVWRAVSLYELIKVMGRSDGAASYEELKASLLRLANLTVVIKVRDIVSGKPRRRTWISNLISLAIEEGTGRNGQVTPLLSIGLNGRLSSAILGDDGWTYAQVNLAQRGRLTSDYAKAAHAWLSSYVWVGNEASLHIDKLLGWIAPVKRIARPETLIKDVTLDVDDSSKTEDEIQKEREALMVRVRKARQRLRDGLDQIREVCGWSIIEESDGMLRIKRPSV